MRLLAVFGLTLMCCYATTIETNDNLFGKHAELFDMLKDFLNDKARTIIQNGNEDIGIPPLDPFNMKIIPVNIDTDMIKMDGELTNAKSNGLSKYEVNDGKFNIIGGIKLMMNLTWPTIFASTDYDFTGKINNDMPIFGKGDIKIILKNLYIWGELALQVKGKGLEVKGVASEFSLEMCDFTITGVFNDTEVSNLLSAIVSDMVPRMMTDNQEDLKSIIHPAVTDVCNNFLANKTISDLIDLLK